jgi:hypothetical protein
LEGWGGDRLLDSYSGERQPIFVETGEYIAAGIERDRAFLERYRPDRDRAAFEQAWQEMARGAAPPQAYEPHYEGSSVVLGPPNSACSIKGGHSAVARPGHHLTPCPLSSGRNVFEELGSGFTLLAFGAADQDVRVIEAAALSLRVPLKVVRDSYAGERQGYASRMILVRPDQYVVWTADQAPRDAAALIRKIAGFV